MVYHAGVPPVEIAASPARVRETFLDFEHMSQWHTSHFKSITPSVTGRKGIDLVPGDSIKIKLDGMGFSGTIKENSPERFVWEGGVSMLLVGTHYFEFRASEKTPGGTTFVQFEDFTGLFTFGLKGNKGDDPKKSGGFQRLNDDLKRKAESLA